MAREQQDTTQQHADSLQSQLAHSETQMQAVQRQNSRLLADVVAAQRKAAEVTKEKVQVAAELAEMQHEVTKTSGLSQEMQHRLQAASSDHAQALVDLRSAHLSSATSSLYFMLPVCPATSGLLWCNANQRTGALDQHVHEKC